MDMTIKLREKNTQLMSWRHFCHSHASEAGMFQQNRSQLFDDPVRQLGLPWTKIAYCILSI